MRRRLPSPLEVITVIAVIVICVLFLVTAEKPAKATPTGDMRGFTDEELRIQYLEKKVKGLRATIDDLRDELDEVAPAVATDAFPVVGSGGGSYTLSSTAYCLTGTMANGEQVYSGAVASSVLPMGASVKVLETGSVYTVADRGAPFDIWMADCDAAIAYGRQTVTVAIL